MSSAWKPRLFSGPFSGTFSGSFLVFNHIQIFYALQIGETEESVQYRSILHVLKDSLEDCSTSDFNEVHTSIQTEVRYKLIIDPSEDDSLVRLLFKYGVLNRDQTRLYICSDFPGDSHMRVGIVFDGEYNTVNTLCL